MLNFLAISNVVLIDRAEINFAPALSVITGETGSGKSILLDALGLAVGFRSNFRLVGESEAKSSVTAEFDISQNRACQALLIKHELGDEERFDEGKILRIRRVLQKEGGGKIYVNDHPIGQALLAAIGQALVEICGQNEQRGLLNSRDQRAILDEYSANSELLKAVEKAYQQLTQVQRELSALQAAKAQVQIEKDYLLHSIKELDAAAIKLGEEEQLTNQKNQLESSKKIQNFLAEVETKLKEISSTTTALTRILLRNQSLIDKFLTPKNPNPDLNPALTNKPEFEQLGEWLNHSDAEFAGQISVIEKVKLRAENSELNEEEIMERLLTIRSLARKFNTTSDQLPVEIERLKIRLVEITVEEESEQQLLDTQIKSRESYYQLAKKLSEQRKAGAAKLAHKVESELKLLKMEEVKFVVEVTVANQAPAPTGLDQIRFMAAINRKSVDEIAKIASGGELSRFMLALKLALVSVSSVPTLIFDEIDAGIGGATSDAVGNRLKALAAHLQVIVVTHQAAIASKADVHFKISKIRETAKVQTIVTVLEERARKAEIARMLLGDKISDEGLIAAEQMIKNSS